MYCIKCGAQIPDEAVFCPKCGARVGNTAPTQPPVQQPVQPPVQQVYPPQQTYTAPPTVPVQPVRTASAPAQQAPKKGSRFLRKLLSLVLVLAIAYFVFPLVKDRVLEFIDEKFGTEFSGKEPGGTPFIPGNDGNNTDPGNSGNNSDPGNSVNPGNNGNSSNPGTNGNNSNNGGNSNNGNSGSNGNNGNSGNSTNPPAVPAQDVGKVSFSDFNVVNEYRKNGMPSGLVTLAPYETEGTWKYGLQFENEDLTYYEIGKCVISFGQYATTLNLYPEMAHDGYEAWPVSGDEVSYATMTGTVYDDEISFNDGNGLIIVIGNFRADESDSYAVGTVITAGGRQGEIMLVKSAF